MKKIFSLSLVLVFGIGWASGFHASSQSSFTSAPPEIQNRNADGAFRDGLYLGRLAAQRRVQPHITVGRWATPQDRASFTAGYRTGYDGMFKR